MSPCWAYQTEELHPSGVELFFARQVSATAGEAEWHLFERKPRRIALESNYNRGANESGPEDPPGWSDVGLFRRRFRSTELPHVTTVGW